MSWRAPLILLLAGFTISASVILWEIVYGQERQYRDPYQEDRGRRTQQQFYQLPPPPANDEGLDFLESAQGVLLQQGISGVVLAVCFFFIWKQNGQARADREKLEERIFSLTEKTNQVMLDQKAEHEKHGTELQNISRELERIRG